MKTYKIMFSILFIGLIVAMGSLSSKAQEALDGKKIFMDKKCNSCHSIESLGIEKSNPKAKGTDLSKVGDEFSEEFIAKYLKKEETLNGKKHGVAFKGTDEEFNALVQWMASLKVEPKPE